MHTQLQSYVKTERKKNIQMMINEFSARGIISLRFRNTSHCFWS